MGCTDSKPKGHRSLHVHSACERGHGSVSPYTSLRPRLAWAPLATALFCAAIMGQQCAPEPGEPNVLPPAVNQPQVTLHTNQGDIVIELFMHQAPTAAANFLQYLQEGYYDDAIFHDTDTAKIAGGEVTTSLSPKAARPLVNESNNGLANLRGRVALYGPEGVASGVPAFIINLEDNPTLDYSLAAEERVDYTVIGRIVHGMNVAKAIGALDRTSRGEFGRLPTTSVSVNDPDLAITDYLDPDDPDDPQEPETVRVWLETTMGEIILEVLVSEAPVTAANFLEYVDSGFYDGTIFHRVIPGFVVQGGGFQPGLVTREGVRDPIINEFSPQRSNVRGTLAMAKRGDDPDSATSQFFFNLVDNSGNLDNQNGGFTVFARVVAGMEVVDAMAAAETTTKTTSEGNAIDDVPVTEIVLITAARL